MQFPHESEHRARSKIKVTLILLAAIVSSAPSSAGFNCLIIFWSLLHRAPRVIVCKSAPAYRSRRDVSRLHPLLSDATAHASFKSLLLRGICALSCQFHPRKGAAGTRLGSHSLWRLSLNLATTWTSYHSAAVTCHKSLQQEVSQQPGLSALAASVPVHSHASELLHSGWDLLLVDVVIAETCPWL